jgi:hypothetical protein
VGGSKIPIAAAVAIACGVVVYLAYAPKPKPAPAPVMTNEGRAYLEHLALSDVGMEASDSFAKISVTEIAGKITNKGARMVETIRVNCVFRDVYGREIKRERVTVTGARTGRLEPGATKSFHLNFDDIPETWNQAMPDLVIAEITFG